MFLATSGVCIFPEDPSKYEKAFEDHKVKQKLVKKELLVLHHIKMIFIIQVFYIKHIYRIVSKIFSPSCVKNI